MAETSFRPNQQSSEGSLWRWHGCFGLGGNGASAKTKKPILPVTASSPEKKSSPLVSVCPFLWYEAFFSHSPALNLARRQPQPSYNRTPAERAVACCLCQCLCRVAMDEAYASPDSDGHASLPSPTDSTFDLSRMLFPSKRHGTVTCS